ncbi:polysaccharide deacetylase family protein [Pueribacillus theae]|nr:polysaccharide deacetylase family protein [Pueribacillus theae]
MKKKKMLKKSEQTVILAIASFIVFFIFLQVLPLQSSKERNEEVTAIASSKVTDVHTSDEENSQKESSEENQERELGHSSKEQPSAEEEPSEKEPKNKETEEENLAGGNKESSKEDLAGQGGNKEKQKIVYLTFDDGPSDVEEELLDLLGKYHAKATFFMLEPNMKKYPDAIKKMVNEGHAVGMHGVTHDIKKFYKSKSTVLEEMNKGQASLEEISGVRSFLIRTPYGSVPHMTPEYKQAVNEHGYKLWDWNVDSNDWKYRDGRYVENSINQIKKIEQSGGEPIILLHSKSSTLKHLSSLLDYLTENGYVMERIEEDMEPYHF